MRKIVVLNHAEIAELDRQDPDTEKDGGFQGFLVKLQRKLRRGTQELILDEKDLEKISRYAFDSGKGTWENRLVHIFSLELGPKLGRD